MPDELVAAAMSGDRDAVARLLEVIRPLVARYCRGRLGPVDRSFLSADDVAQEVCLAVLTALPNYRVQGKPFLAFVYGIAAHKVIDAHRSVSRGRTDPVADVPDAVETGAGPEQRALRGELSAQLRALLDSCPRSSARSSCCASSSGCRRRRPRRSSGPARVRSGWPSTGRSAACARTSRRTSARAPA